MNEMAVDKEQIARNMRRNKSKDTKPELLLRRELWKRGLRYRKNYKFLDGKPDVVFLRAQIAVFVDGKMWHGLRDNAKGRRHKARHEALGHGFGYEVRSSDDVAGAIVCGGMGRERNLIVDKRQTNLTPVTHIKGEINKEGIRKMTPREWARLQGFPDDFILPLADVHLYKQFGNSVTVPVIKAIAQTMPTIFRNVFSVRFIFRSAT